MVWFALVITYRFPVQFFGACLLSSNVITGAKEVFSLFLSIEYSFYFWFFRKRVQLCIILSVLKSDRLLVSR